MARCFFFYGTLMAGGGNAVAKAAHAKLGAGRAGTVAGRLYAIADPQGWYPALLPGAGRVAGFVYAAGPEFGADDLAALDGYELFYPDDPAGSEYRRGEVAVTLADGAEASAEAYLYARALPEGAVLIEGGNFAAFLAETGAKPFTP